MPRGTGYLSLSQVPVCGSKNNDSRRLCLRSCKLRLSLSGPQFPYLQNGSDGISRKE